MAPEPPCLVQTPCAKTAKSYAFCVIRRKPNSGTVRRFSPLKPAFFFRGFGLRLLVSNGFSDAKAGFVGFGSGLLASWGFFCAKAPLQPWFCQRHCVSLCKGTKLQTVCRSFMEGSCWGFPLFLILLKVFPSLPERRCGSVQYFCHIL